MMNRIANLLAFAIAVLVFQSFNTGVVIAQTPVESIPVPEPVPEPAEPVVDDIELDLGDDFESEDDLAELDDEDEFKLVPVPDDAEEEEPVVMSDDTPLLILGDDASSSDTNVVSDPKVAPVSHDEFVGESTNTSADQPLRFSPTDDEAPLEPIIDQQMSNSAAPSSSTVNSPGVFIPNQPGIVADSPSTTIQSASPRVIQPGVVYGQTNAQPTYPNYVRSYQPNQVPGNVTYRYQSAPPAQQVRIVQPSANAYRVPAVVQPRVVTQQPVVVQQQNYRAYSSPAPVTTDRRVVVQNPSTTRVEQTGPNTYRVTTTTTRYVPVQVRVPQRTPVYQPGISVRPATVQGLPAEAEIPYLPGRPLRNVIRGAFR